MPEYVTCLSDALLTAQWCSALFICLMYLLPPVNIQKVIFPGKSRRELVAGLAGLAAVGLLITDFFI